MNTLHVDSERTWRGGEQQALYLVTNLRRRGHAAEVAGVPGSPFVERARAAAVPAHEVPMRGDLDLAAAWRLARIVKHGGHRLIHAHTSHAHALAALAAWLAGVPCVVSRRVDFAVGTSLFKRWKYRFGVTRYLAISAAVRDVLVQGGVTPERIRVVHSGIDLSRLDGADGARARATIGEALANDAPVVGALCHFAWHKGLDVLLDAVPLVLERRPDARFVLVGTGELEAELKAQAARVAPPGAVVFAGFRDDAPSCLAAFDVVAAPSVMEGLNTTILDSLALERPVVASAVGGIPEAVLHERTGLLVPPRDPRALAAALLRVLDDPALGRRLGTAGRAHVLERFTCEATCDGTLAAYREILGESPLRVTGTAAAE